MKSTVSIYDFERAFANMDRKENFSYDGKRALFEYLEEYEDDINEEIELDVISLCCDYTEYEDLEDFQKNYSDEYKSIEDIEKETTVIRIEDSNSFIIQTF